MSNTANLSTFHRFLSETVSALSRKSAGKACGMKIASFLVGICQKQRFLHYSKREEAGNAVSAFCPEGVRKKTT